MAGSEIEANSLTRPIQFTANLPLEKTGFAKANLEALWIDPAECETEL
jgi:hypothetical protein